MAAPSAILEKLDAIRAVTLGHLDRFTMFESLPADANLELKHVGGLDPTNGLEWLEGYGGHEAYHHRQIDTLAVQVAQIR